ncbi:A disintegrin and metalloproteinase with thrombospondin motifs 7-like [Oppia nitens]|uniref:A disintegrin and metalloproteinase with thrombospondin motifs 7-like n=1 Tax=Oppia nitens TaxID=1686743 RepID=UPI0023D99BB9|nr:A disintegrin and metalloproteinase with thrombospondin motifs 7-like [Oppia nitens]
MFIQSYEIQIPEKISSDGRFISYTLNHELSTRKTRSSDSQSDDVYYSIPLQSYGKLVLSLSPNKRLLAPSVIVEKWTDDGLIGSNSDDLSSHLFNPIKKFCYYEGFIRNITNSLVSVSTCDGLRGVIRIDGNDLFIEPIEANVNHKQPNHHKITKRSVEQYNQNNNNFPEKICGVKNEYESGIQRRKRWETKRKHQNKQQNYTSLRKRSVSLERNVETLIVADPTMVDYYTDEDLQMYILTIMNVVSGLYHDHSIGNAINIIIVRVILLQNQTTTATTTTHRLATNFSDSTAPNATLKNFCRWQQVINPPEEGHPNHHDTAVLITRNNICRTPNDKLCNSLGLAEIAGMCQPLRSCALTEDTGLSLAFTIAHEIGHNFGMSHDGSHNHCVTSDGHKHHIMSPSLTLDTIPVWSNCSRTEITNFLDREWGYCLDDEPTQHVFNYPELPAGTMYNTDHQCRLQYGPESKYCNEMQDVNLCETLWCQTGDQCISKLKPAAEGTICGQNRWCYLGECVEIGERPPAIDGEWGPWSNWSDCSRECGAGVMYSERECNNPLPSNGGRYCIGERKRYKVCNTQPCGYSNKTFRAIQCSSYDGIEFKGQYYKWQPVLTPATPCELYCKPEGKSFSIRLSDTVIDGTPCRRGSKDMCVNGMCRSVSCDWNFDSESQEDRCGICGGDSTQCLTIKGNFNQTKGFGYIQILYLPEGVSNLKVEKLYADDNYLAVMDNKGEYILNGDFMIDWTGEYSLYDTTVYYDRDSGGKETLQVPGLLRGNITIMLLFQSENRGIKWEYTVANVNHSRSPEFEWLLDEYGICSQTCGRGIQIRKVRCYEKEGGLVEDKYCYRLSSKPLEEKRICNQNNCPARWWSGPWQHCNATCDSNKGVRKRSVLCVRSMDSDEQLALRNSECDATVKPLDSEECIYQKPCPKSTTTTTNSINKCAKNRL